METFCLIKPDDAIKRLKIEGIWETVTELYYKNRVVFIVNYVMHSIMLKPCNLFIHAIIHSHTTPRSQFKAI